MSGHTAPTDVRSVLCLTYPAFGHVLPLLPVLAELAGRGHRVTVTTGERFADRLRDVGADPAVYRTALTDDPPPESVTADELARRTLDHVEVTIAISEVVEEAVAAHRRPDVVVHDTTLWAPARVLGHRWGAGVVQVVPTLASNEHFSVTERLGRIAPPVDPAHPAVVRVGERLAEFAAAHGAGDNAEGVPGPRTRRKHSPWPTASASCAPAGSSRSPHPASSTPAPPPPSSPSSSAP